MNIFIRSLLTLGLACGATQGSAASVFSFVDVTVSDPTTETLRDSESGEQLIVDTMLSESTGGSTASATLDANLETGIIKFGTTATTAAQDLSATGGIPARASVSIEYFVLETFTADGDGTVTFDMAFDGFLTRTDTAGVLDRTTNFVQSNTLARINFYYEDPLTGDFISEFNEETLNLSEQGETATAIDTVFSASFDVVDGQVFSVDIGFGSISNILSIDSTALSAETNFLSTAILDITTTDGLEVAASDAAFLSRTNERDGVPAVPLPASAPLLMAGIGVMIWRRRAA